MDVKNKAVKAQETKKPTGPGSPNWPPVYWTKKIFISSIISTASFTVVGLLLTFNPFFFLWIFPCYAVVSTGLTFWIFQVLGHKESQKDSIERIEKIDKCTVEEFDHFFVVQHKVRYVCFSIAFIASAILGFFNLWLVASIAPWLVWSFIFTCAKIACAPQKLPASYIIPEGQNINRPGHSYTPAHSRTAIVHSTGMRTYDPVRSQVYGYPVFRVKN